MSLYYDIDLLEELEWLVNCLIDDKIPYRASLNIDSDNKPYGYISNKRISLTIRRAGKKLMFYIRDEDAVNHARKEGFTEEQIKECIKCCHIVDRELAEIMITNPSFFAECKTEVIKENLAKNNKENT